MSHYTWDLNDLNAQGLAPREHNGPRREYDAAEADDWRGWMERQEAQAAADTDAWEGARERCDLAEDDPLAEPPPWRWEPMRLTAPPHEDEPRYMRRITAGMTALAVGGLCAVASVQAVRALPLEVLQWSATVGLWAVLCAVALILAVASETAAARRRWR